MHAPLTEIPIPDGPSSNQLHDDDWHTLPLSDYTDLGACVGSPFADDFGNDHNGFHFQDGTSEQDVSFASILDDLENKRNLNEELTSHINPAVTSGNLIHDFAVGLDKTPYASEMNEYNLQSETSAKTGQAQVCVVIVHTLHYVILA